MDNINKNYGNFEILHIENQQTQKTENPRKLELLRRLSIIQN